MKGEFSVCQFFADGTYTYVRRFINAQEAVTLAHSLTQNAGASIGITQRIIITDGGDHCVFEWQHGQGVTWPTPEQRLA